MNTLRQFLFGQSPLKQEENPDFNSRRQAPPLRDSTIARASNYLDNMKSGSMLRRPRFSPPPVFSDADALEVLGHIRDPFMFYHMLSEEQIREHPDVEKWLYQLWNDPEERSNQSDFLMTLRDKGSVNTSKSNSYYSPLPEMKRSLPSEGLFDKLTRYTENDWSELPPKQKLREIQSLSPIDMNPLGFSTRGSTYGNLKPIDTRRPFRYIPSPQGTPVSQDYFNGSPNTIRPRKYLSSVNESESPDSFSSQRTAIPRDSYPVVSRISYPNEDSDDEDVDKIISQYYGGKAKKRRSRKKATKPKKKSLKRKSSKRKTKRT